MGLTTRPAVKINGAISLKRSEAGESYRVRQHSTAMPMNSAAPIMPPAYLPKKISRCAGGVGTYWAYADIPPRHFQNQPGIRISAPASSAAILAANDRSNAFRSRHLDTLHSINQEASGMASCGLIVVSASMIPAAHKAPDATASMVPANSAATIR